MDKELSHKQIISILLPFTILLITYFWSYGKSTDVVRPLILKSTPWQTLTLPLSNGDIYEFTETGKLLRTIDTKELGISHYIGDIQFISRNKIIIYGGYTGPTTQDNIMAFTRSTPDVEYRKQEGLWLCTLDEYTCKPFTHELPSIKQAFHLDFDSDHQHVYLTNTSHHELYRFNMSGDILEKTNANELKFPNQIRTFDQSLWLVDTNNKTIKQFEMTQGSLASPKGFFPISFNPSCQGEKTQTTGLINSVSRIVGVFSKPNACWPTSIAKVDNTIWVGVKNNNLEDGEIHIYSTSGFLQSKLDFSELNTPFVPDPIAFTQVKNQVIFSDLNNLRLYSYHLPSQKWQVFSVPEIQSVLEASLENKMFYRTVSHSVMLIFVLLIVTGVFFGLRTPKKAKEVFEAVPSENAIFPQPKAMPFWFQESTLSKSLMLIMGICILMMIVCLYLLSTLLEFKTSLDELNFYLFSVLIISFLLPILFITYLSKQNKLGIAGRLILLSKQDGQTIIKQVHEVTKVGNRGLLVGDLFFNFGGIDGKFLNKQEFKHYLEPRLVVMKTMTEWEYLKLRFKHPSKESKFQVLSFIPSTLLFSYLFFTGAL